MALKKAKSVDETLFRRRYPRRTYQRKVGVLAAGHFLVCEAGELGEGGLSIISEFVFSVGSEALINFQIPGGAFISLRAKVRTIKKDQKSVLHGLAFVDVPFQQRRQIRAFVSERVEGLL